MYSRNTSSSKIVLNPLHPDRALIPKFRYATHGDFPHGRVKVTCQSLPSDKWFFAVTDTGIGIAPEDRKRIFEPYSQAFFNQGRRKHEGTGLGLALVSRLVKLLQGEIQLDSEVEVGSTFTVTLPLSIQINNIISS